MGMGMEWQARRNVGGCSPIYGSCRCWRAGCRCVARRFSDMIGSRWEDGRLEIGAGYVCCSFLCVCLCFVVVVAAGLQLSVVYRVRSLKT